MIKRITIGAVVICGMLLTLGKLTAQNLTPKQVASPHKLKQELVASDEAKMHKVVDSLMNRMSLKEKIAQLYIVQFSSRQNDNSKKKIEKYIKREGIGGMILMYDDLYPSVEYINKLKSLSKYPMLFTIDAEWGVSMRYDKEIVPFPRQGQLGALPSDSLIYEMGLAIGRQCLRAGFEVNFAPAVDVNNNLNNPVIHTRSFGSDKERVAEYSIAYMKGMQDAGILTSAKHFPGHGDTDVDSHHLLPVIPHDMERLYDIELYPFRRLIEEGVDMVMVGHLDIPALDSSGKPSSVSENIITNLLRKEMGYDGIIITDGLNMNGITSQIDLKRIPFEAFKAGCDIILMPDDVSKSIKLIARAIRRGEIPLSQLNESCRRVLEAKYRTGLLPNNRNYVDPSNIKEELNSEENMRLMEEIAKESITLIYDGISDKAAECEMIREGERRFAYIGLGLDTFPEPDKFDFYPIAKDASSEDINLTLSQLGDYDVVVFGVHNTTQSPPRRFGLIAHQQEALVNYSVTNREKGSPQTTIMAFFGSPYALPLFEPSRYDLFLLGYSPTEANLKAMISIVLQEIQPKGRLSIEL